MDMMREARGAADLASSSARKEGFNETVLFGVSNDGYRTGDGCAIQCGNYTMTGDGMTVINGETVAISENQISGKRW